MPRICPDNKDPMASNATHSGAAYPSNFGLQESQIILRRPISSQKNSDGIRYPLQISELWREPLEPSCSFVVWEMKNMNDAKKMVGFQADHSQGLPRFAAKASFPHLRVLLHSLEVRACFGGLPRNDSAQAGKVGPKLGGRNSAPGEIGGKAKGQESDMQVMQIMLIHRMLKILDCREGVATWEDRGTHRQMSIIQKYVTAISTWRIMA